MYRLRRLSSFEPISTTTLEICAGISQINNYPKDLAIMRNQIKSPLKMISLKKKKISV